MTHGLGGVQGLGAEVFGQNLVAQKFHAYGLTFAKDCDPQGMLEMVFWVEIASKLKPDLVMDSQTTHPIATVGPDVIFGGFPADEVPSVSVFFEQIGVKAMSRGLS